MAILFEQKGGMEGREKGVSPFKIQCANAAAAASVTREMRSGEQGVITMRGGTKGAGGPHSAFSRIVYIMKERVMDGVKRLVW